MSWTTPKTDWYGSTDADGVYTGDRFNAEDFNRIKNNLQYLRDLAIKLYAEFTISDMGNDRAQGDYFYADEINLLENNLTTINKNTLNKSYGTAPIYMDNGNTMDYTELNRLEGAILSLYENMTNALNSRRKFRWMFGKRGVDL